MLLPQQTFANPLTFSARLRPDGATALDIVSFYVISEITEMSKISERAANA
jgi:hypothetical protein